MKRVYHTWEKWECYPAGFYEDKPPERFTSPRDAETAYADFLRDSPRFEAALARVLTEWPHSCEHYLSNENMNRIAWLGQASACIAEGLPAAFRGGFHRLSPAQQETANTLALTWLNVWLERRGEPTLTPDTAAARTKVALY